jgi:hypothetical protein
VAVYVTPFLSDAAIVADMTQVAVGVRDRVTLFFDPSRYAKYDQSLVRLTARVDIGVLNAEGVELLPTSRRGSHGLPWPARPQQPRGACGGYQLRQLTVLLRPTRMWSVGATVPIGSRAQRERTIRSCPKTNRKPMQSTV